MSIKTITEYHDKEETKLKSEIQKDTETGLIASKIEYNKDGVKTFFGLHERTNPKDGSRFFEREDTVLGSKVRSPVSGKVVFEREVKISEKSGAVHERMYDENGNQTREITKTLPLEIERHENGNVKRMDYGHGIVKDKFGLEMPLVSLLFEEDGILDKTLVRDITTGKLNNLNIPIEEEYSPLKYSVHKKGNKTEIKLAGEELLKVQAFEQDYGLLVLKDQFYTSDNEMGFETSESPFYKTRSNPENNAILERTEYLDSGGRIETKYSNLGKIKEANHYEGVSSHPYLTEKYDSIGLLLTEKYEYDKKDFSLKEKTVIDYTKDFQLDKITKEQFEHSIKVSTTVEKYENGGTLKSRSTFDSSGELEREQNFQLNDDREVVLKSVRTKDSLTNYDEKGKPVEENLKEEDLKNLGIKKSEPKKRRKP